MNSRTEHRKEQGEAAARDFKSLWDRYLFPKVKYFGMCQRELDTVRHVAKLAFFAGAFTEFRETISDED